MIDYETEIKYKPVTLYDAHAIIQELPIILNLFANNDEVRDKLRAYYLEVNEDVQS